MDDSGAVLDLRDQVAVAASALGLTPDDALRAAYEDATAGLEQATTLANAQLTALGDIAAAKAQVEAPPDLVTQAGLLGETPRSGYDAARAAFEAGQLDEAARQATETSTLLAAAPGIGRDRIVAVGGSVLGLLLVLALVVLVARRRRATRRALAAATATLAADPVAAPAPTSALPADEEESHGSDDAPADP